MNKSDGRKGKTQLWSEWRRETETEGEKAQHIEQKNYKLFHLMQTHKITENVNRNSKSAEKIRWNSHFLLAAVPIVHSRTHSCAVSAPDMQFDDAQ